MLDGVAPSVLGLREPAVPDIHPGISGGWRGNGTGAPARLLSFGDCHVEGASLGWLPGLWLAGLSGGRGGLALSVAGSVQPLFSVTWALFPPRQGLLSEEELAHLEQASAVATEVTSSIVRLRLEVEEKKRAISLLQTALVRHPARGTPTGLAALAVP